MRIRPGARIPLVLLAGGLTACAAETDSSDLQEGTVPLERGSQAPAPQPPPRPASRADGDRIERTGRVVVSGPEGLRMVGVFTEDGRSTSVTGGGLVDDLIRLSGAVVRVAGSPVQVMGREGIEITEYEIVSINDERPAVGLLSGGQGSFRLDGDDPVALVGVPDELAAQLGARIWVTGPETPEGRRVQSYGVIRPAS